MFWWDYSTIGPTMRCLRWIIEVYSCWMLKFKGRHLCWSGDLVEDLSYMFVIKRTLFQPSCSCLDIGAWSKTGRGRPPQGRGTSSSPITTYNISDNMYRWCRCENMQLKCQWGENLVIIDGGGWYKLLTNEDFEYSALREGSSKNANHWRPLPF